MDPVLMMMLLNMMAPGGPQVGGGGQQSRPQQPQNTPFGMGQTGTLGELLMGLGGMNPYGYGSQLGGSVPDFYDLFFGARDANQGLPGSTFSPFAQPTAPPPAFFPSPAPQLDFMAAMLEAANTPAATPAAYAGPQPLGIDPALWAASGPGGLSTAEGGYSQDPAYWENMNRIATGTQTFTPWQQAPTAARAKPLRGGFSGIPVPRENTVGSVQNAFGVGGQPFSRSTAPATVNTTPTIGNTGINPFAVGGPLAGVGRFGAGSMNIPNWLRGVGRFQR